jgi:hypothetical protein
VLEGTRYFKTLFIIFSGLIIGSLAYRYYAFTLFYQEHQCIKEKVKKISLEHREISSWYHKKMLNKTISDGYRPKIVIKIETD